MKYFENGGKNMSFIIKDDSTLVEYNEIWSNIKKALGIKFRSMSVYDEKYIKAKVREFNAKIKTKFWVDEIHPCDVGSVGDASHWYSLYKY